MKNTELIEIVDESGNVVGKAKIVDFGNQAGINDFFNMKGIQKKLFVKSNIEEKSLIQKAYEIAEVQSEEKISDYGDFIDVAFHASDFASKLSNKRITPLDFVACMIGMKFGREFFKHKDDNILDAMVYMNFYEKLKNISLHFEEVYLNVYGDDVDNSEHRTGVSLKELHIDFKHDKTFDNPDEWLFSFIFKANKLGYTRSEIKEYYLKNIKKVK